MHVSTSDVPTSAVELVRAGLLEIGDGCRVQPTAVFMPKDMLGIPRPIVLGDRVTIGAYAVVHGGVRIGPDTVVGHQVIVGEAEYGYALRNVYPGAGRRRSSAPVWCFVRALPSMRESWSVTARRSATTPC